MVFKLGAAARANVVVYRRVWHLRVKANGAGKHLSLLQALSGDEFSCSARMSNLFLRLGVERAQSQYTICNSEVTDNAIQKESIPICISSDAPVEIRMQRLRHESISNTLILFFGRSTKFMTMCVKMGRQLVSTCEGHGLSIYTSQRRHCPIELKSDHSQPPLAKKSLVLEGSSQFWSGKQRVRSTRGTCRSAHRETILDTPSQSRHPYRTSPAPCPFETAIRATRPGRSAFGQRELL